MVVLSHYLLLDASKEGSSGQNKKKDATINFEKGCAHGGELDQTTKFVIRRDCLILITLSIKNSECSRPLSPHLSDNEIDAWRRIPRIVGVM